MAGDPNQAYGMEDMPGGPYSDDEWDNAEPWSWPEDPLPYPDVEREDWENGRCYNCGYWARADPDHPGEFECENCGDTWNIYEPPPEIP